MIWTTDLLHVQQKRKFVDIPDSGVRWKIPSDGMLPRNVSGPILNFTISIALQCVQYVQYIHLYVVHNPVILMYKNSNISPGIIITSQLSYDTISCQFHD